MLFPLIGGYIVGGFFWGAIFSIVYCLHYVRHQRRKPWSIFLGAGWLVCLTGIILMLIGLSAPQGYNDWQGDWSLGSIGVGLGFWWVCALVYLWPHLLRESQK